jgi:hypothetical protein
MKNYSHDSIPSGSTLHAVNGSAPCGIAGAVMIKESSPTLLFRDIKKWFRDFPVLG